MNWDHNRGKEKGGGRAGHFLASAVGLITVMGVAWAGSGCTTGKGGTPVATAVMGNATETTPIQSRIESPTAVTEDSQGDTPTDAATQTPSATLTRPPKQIPMVEAEVIDAKNYRRLSERSERAYFVNGLILELALTPNGDQMAVSAGENILWFGVAENGGEKPTLVGSFHAGSLTRTLLFLPNMPGRLLSGSNDGFIRLWENGMEKPLAEWEAHKRGVNRLKSQPGGNLLATAGNTPQVYLWDLAGSIPPENAVRELIGAVFAVPDLMFSEDGERLISVDGEVVRVRTAADGRLVHSLRVEMPVIRLALPAGKNELILATTDGQLEGWDLISGKKSWELDLRENSPAWSMAVSANGNILAAGLKDGTVCLLPLPMPTEAFCITAHERPVSTLGFHPGGKALFSGSYDGWVRVWSIGR